MSQTFANSINSNPIFAARSTADADGNNIASTYATQSTVSAIRQVPAASSADQNKVLGVTDAQGTVGWVQGGGANTHTIVVDDTNPYGLPPKTMRVQFANTGYDPRTNLSDAYFTCAQVSSSPNIWDITVNRIYGEFGDYIPYDTSGGFSVLDLNTYGLSDLSWFFYNCSAVTSITILNGYSVEGLYYFCASCNHLTSINLQNFNKVKTMELMCNYDNALQTASVTGLDSVVNMSQAFYQCDQLIALPDWSNESFSHLENVINLFAYDYNVQSGIQDMYTQLSSIPSIIHHSDAFTLCGSSGPAASELNNIPSSWGGNA